MTEIVKPSALKEGSTIGIAAPSGAFSREKFEKGVAMVESCGFRVKYSEKIFRKHGYLAGTDAERADEMNVILSDPSIDAVMFARGGYGIQRIMHLLDFSTFKKIPKPIVGFSDFTALLSFIVSCLNTTCFYGPVVTMFSEAGEETISAFRNALTSKSSVPKAGGLKVMKEGSASGRLSGGCLTLISTGVGTDFENNVKGTILFLEDVGEHIYRYDRMITHLKNSGILEGVRGIVFGTMGCVDGETEEELWSVIGELLRDFDGPVVHGLRSGHTEPFITIPLGVTCTLNADDTGMLIFEEPALS